MTKIRQTARKQVAPPHVVNDSIQKRRIKWLEEALEESEQHVDSLEAEIRILRESLASVRGILREGLEAVVDTRQNYPPSSEESIHRQEDSEEEEDPSEQPSE